MPQLDDAKFCYVGTQVIKKIMAGGKEVWPKPTLNTSIIPARYFTSSSKTEQSGVYFERPNWPTNEIQPDCTAFKSLFRIEIQNPDGSVGPWDIALRYKVVFPNDPDRSFCTIQMFIPVMETSNVPPGYVVYVEENDGILDDKFIYPPTAPGTPGSIDISSKIKSTCFPD